MTVLGPPLPNPQHEAFAQAVQRGMELREAYAATHPAVTRKTACRNGARLASNALVRARITELQAASATATVLTMRERREFLARVVRADASKLDLAKDGDLIQEVIIDERGTKYKLPGKRECIMDDAKLAGEIIDKVEAKDTTPRESLETVRARFEAAKVVHGRS